MLFLVLLGTLTPTAWAQPAKPHAGGGEANIVLPNLNDVKFLGDQIGGRDLLLSGLIVSALGIAFGLVVCAGKETSSA